MKKLSILLAGVCLTAALYSVGTTYGQNKTNFAKQKEDTVTTNKYQGVTIKDKAKGKVTKQQVRELKKDAKQKAIDHVEEQNALYVEAIKNGFDVTDDEVKAYIEELKKNINNSDNKDEVMEIVEIKVRVRSHDGLMFLAGSFNTSYFTTP